MRRIILILLIAVIGNIGTQARKPNIYKLQVKDANGQTVSMKAFKGRVLLIVNTATRCGFTPQYTELEQLYEAYHSQGLEILDFPCNQFGQQAPGTIGEITQFCTATYGTQFPQFDKIDVNGPEAHPLFTFLKGQQPFRGFGTSKQGEFMHQMMVKRDPAYADSPDIKWNFTKFLVDRKDRVVARFEPTDDMQKVKEAIETLL
jgi:glutathione peroxidase